MADSEGWIEWSGGECPVEPDTPVEYETLDGLRSVCTSGSLDWHHLDDLTDIVRYRALVPQAQRDELLAVLEEATGVVIGLYGAEARLAKSCMAAIASVKGGAA